MNDDDDMGPGVPEVESDAFLAGWDAASEAWDAQATPSLNPYPTGTNNHRDWDKGSHEYCENNI
jgi:hypothetical protein